MTSVTSNDRQPGERDRDPDGQPSAPAEPTRARAARFRARGHPLHRRAGRFENGDLAEIFLSTSKHGTAVDVTRGMQRSLPRSCSSTVAMWTRCAKP